MKAGDLVKFESSFFNIAARGYANPGVILGRLGVNVNVDSRRYRVMWADQRITIEHVSYLKPLTSS